MLREWNLYSGNKTFFPDSDVDASPSWVRFLLAFAFPLLTSFFFNIKKFIKSICWGDVVVVFRHTHRESSQKFALQLRHLLFNLFPPGLSFTHSIRIRRRQAHVTHNDAKWALSKQITWFKSCLRFFSPLPTSNFNSCIRIATKALSMKMAMAEKSRLGRNFDEIFRKKTSTNQRKTFITVLRRLVSQLLNFQLLNSCMHRCFAKYYDRHIDKYDNFDC